MNVLMNPRRLVQPALEPITLAELKLFLRIEHDAEDSLLITLLKAARETAESILATSFIEQTWQWVFDSYQGGSIKLPMPPVLGIEEVATRSAAGAWVILSSGDYQLVEGVLKFSISTAQVAALKITYRAGLGATGDDVPASIKHALLEHVARLYETRGLDDVTDITRVYARLREVKL